MALVLCEECGREISDKAEECIHCGFPLNEEEPRKNKRSASSFILKIVLWTLFTCFVISYFFFNYATPEATLVEVYDREIQVIEDEYKVIEVNLDKTSDVTIEYTVKSGPTIDVYFMSETDFNNYETRIGEGNEEIEVFYNSELSTFGSDISDRTYTVEEGSYYIILDNTDWGVTYPPMNMVNDVATLDLEVTTQ